MYHHFNGFCYNYFLQLIEFIIIFYCYSYVVYVIFIVLHSYIQSCCMCMYISRCVMYALLYNIMNIYMYVCVYIYVCICELVYIYVHLHINVLCIYSKGFI